MVNWPWAGSFSAHIADPLWERYATQALGLAWPAKSRTLSQIDLNEFKCSIHHAPHKAADIEDGRVVETSATVSHAQTRFSLPSIQILTFLSHIPTAPHNKPS